MAIKKPSSGTSISNSERSIWYVFCFSITVMIKLLVKRSFLGVPLILSLVRIRILAFAGE